LFIKSFRKIRQVDKVLDRPPVHSSFGGKIIEDVIRPLVSAKPSAVNERSSLCAVGFFIKFQKTIAIWEKM
jgi:hypothetical protein